MSRETSNEQSEDSVANQSVAPANKRSFGDVLSDRKNKKLLKYAVTVMAIVGAGFGLTGSIGAGQLVDGSSDSEFLGAMFFLSVFVFMLLSGPILGALVGLEFDRRIANTREALITSFASGAVGYVAMVITGVLLATVLMPDNLASSGGEGGAFDLGELIVPLLVMAIPIGAVAAGIVYASDTILD
ncbi:hypothetical protein [Halostella pelagica]|uniref:hypothetical protein n=1 Tax=Halostella pelagica TaxID=2583824 RepID=UPI00107FDC1E|nr:hypothetical protein [Halostella pelagica]